MAMNRANQTHPSLQMADPKTAYKAEVWDQYRMNMGSPAVHAAHIFSALDSPANHIYVLSTSRKLQEACTSYFGFSPLFRDVLIF